MKNEQSLEEEVHRPEIEGQIQRILFNYLGVFEKVGVAAVHIPPPPPVATEAGTPPGTAAATEHNKDPNKAAEEKDGDDVKTATESDIHKITEEVPMDIEIGNGEVPIELPKGNAPNAEEKNGGEGAAANTADKKKDIVMTQEEEEEEKKEETSAEDIISYYASNKGKLKHIVVETIKAVKELNSAFQSFIIFVDTIKESEVLEYKAAQGPLIVKNIASVASPLLVPNKAQVGVSFLYFMFKLMAHGAIEFLGLREEVLQDFNRSFEFDIEDAKPQSKLVTLLSYTLFGLNKYHKSRTESFNEEVNTLLRDHFSRNILRNIEGADLSQVCEELMYFGIAFNFYDPRTSVAVHAIEGGDDVYGNNVVESNPMAEFFNIAMGPINTHKKEIPPLAVVHTLKELTKGMPLETAAMIPGEVYAKLLNLNPVDPEFFFVAHEVFKFAFEPDDKSEIIFDQKEEDNNNNNNNNTNNNNNNSIEIWILVLGTLAYNNKKFYFRLTNVILKAITLHKTPFIETAKKIMMLNPEFLKEHSEGVQNLRENILGLVREVIENNFNIIEPRFIIALPKSVFKEAEFQKQIGSLFLQEIDRYFNKYRNQISTVGMMIELIDRVLGSRGT